MITIARDRLAGFLRNHRIGPGPAVRFHRSTLEDLALEDGAFDGILLADPGVAGEEVAETAGLLLDLARIQDGDGPRDPAGFARRVAEALAGSPA